MTRIELSLKPQPATSIAGPSRFGDVQKRLRAWLLAVVEAEEPCVLVDAEGVIVGASKTFVKILSGASLTDLLGRGLLDGVLEAVDFTTDPQRLSGQQLVRIPPLTAIASGSLARGLIRLRTKNAMVTVDSVATPLRSGGEVVGSLTFFYVLE